MKLGPELRVDRAAGLRADGGGERREQDDSQAVLPLRLSVSRGALSIELGRPYAAAGFLVEELEVGLGPVAFPVDLSRGVKQFRHHRGTLTRLRLRLDLDELAARWALAVGDALGEELLGVRASAGPLAQPGRGSDAQSPTGQNDSFGAAAELGMVSVALFGQRCALSFDLVLASGKQPRFIVDAARGIGLRASPLALVLAVLGRGLASLPGDLSRSGRAIELGGLARAVCCQLLPSLGFRVPIVGPQVVHRAEFARGGLSLVFDSSGEPFQVGSRAIRLAGLCDFTQKADECLALGDAEGAREMLLRVLEAAPGHPDVLLSLAEIDAYTPGRAESALGFLAEAEASGRTHPSGRLLLQARALAFGLQSELATEALESAASLESDGVTAALIHCELAARTDQAGLQREHLNRAVARAPAHPSPRWLRISHNLTHGHLKAALVDAQQVEAMAKLGQERALVAQRLGTLFLQAGHTTSATHWLRRALSARPDDAQLMLQLGSALLQQGENLRAAELYQTALAHSVDAPLGDAEAVEFDRARVSLAKIVAHDVQDLRLAIGYLRGVGSRSVLALDARTLEADLAAQLGDQAARRSARLRLLQAIELGWICVPRLHALLSSIERDERAAQQDDLADFAAHLRDRFGSNEELGYEPEQDGLGGGTSGAK